MLVEGIQKNFKVNLNQRTLLELKIYKAMIKSALFLERKMYKEAKEESSFLIGTLQQFQNLLSAIEQAQINELIKTAQQTLRYCKFQLREFDNDEEKEVLLVMDREDITQMLNKISQEGHQVQKMELKIFGKDFNLDDQKLIKIFEKNRILNKSYKVNQDVNSKEEIYWEIVNNLEEGIKLCHSYKLEAGNNASLIQIWDSIDDFFTYNKTVYLMQKNIKVY